MKELIIRHYRATRQRGLITTFTTSDQFIEKLTEEYEEVKESYLRNGLDGDTVQECIDLVGVIFNMLIHFNCDIEEEYKYNTDHQEQRV